MQRPQRRLPVVLAFPFIAVKERRLKLGSHAPILPTMQPTQDGILPNIRAKRYAQGITQRTEQDWDRRRGWALAPRDGRGRPVGSKRSRSGREVRAMSWPA